MFSINTKYTPLFRNHHHQSKATGHTTLRVYSPFPGSVYTPKSEYALRRPWRTSSILTVLRSSSESDIRTQGRPFRTAGVTSLLRSLCRFLSFVSFSFLFFYHKLALLLHGSLLIGDIKADMISKNSLVHHLTQKNIMFTISLIFYSLVPITLILQRTSTFGRAYLFQCLYYV